MTQHINLLVEKHDDTRFAWASMAVLVLLLATLAGLWFIRLQAVHEVQQEETESARQLELAKAALKAKTSSGDGYQSAESLQSEIKALRPRAEAARQMLAIVRDMGSEHGYAGYFRTLAMVNVDGVWLTNVAISKAGKSVSVTGHALRRELVMQYAQRLNVAFADTDTKFSSVELTPVASGKPAEAGVLRSAVKFKLY